MATARIEVPATAQRGEIVTIRAMIAHAMETGFRRTQLGALIPRDIITRFVCTYNGAEIFRTEFHPAVAANPYLSFSTIATESGTLVFHWSGDNGFTATESAAITIA